MKNVGNTNIELSYGCISLSDIDDNYDGYTFDVDDWHDIKLEIDKMVEEQE